MTAQIPDSFLHEDKKISIVGVHGGSLFNPLEYDLQPLPRITSCWRGYVCMYMNFHNKLVLDTLQVNLGNEGPVIHRIRPVFSNTGMFDNTYNDMNLPIDYTGELLVAEGFIRDLYVHMGFHPAWKHETVFKLTVSHGSVLDTKDVSQEMAVLRNKMKSQPLQPGREASQEEVEKWIASTFRQDHGIFDENK